MKERILQVMKQEGLTSSKFAEAIGIQRSAMSHIISGRNNPSLDVLMKILEAFTYINSDWLLFGKGPMQKQQEISQPEEPTLFPNTDEIPPSVQVISENRREIGVKVPGNQAQPTVIERVMPIQMPSKNVSKIMIFYSDNTFDTFIPEKKVKE
ncbi:MAG: helix-turn-helix domain-containing protein [Tannerellaceae bacterium]|nr:helix-turn-helix domain-containing protein [Tannerellaceae bacterium]